MTPWIPHLHQAGENGKYQITLAIQSRPNLRNALRDVALAILDCPYTGTDGKGTFFSPECELYSIVHSVNSRRLLYALQRNP